MSYHPVDLDGADSTLLPRMSYHLMDLDVADSPPLSYDLLLGGLGWGGHLMMQLVYTV